VNEALAQVDGAWGVCTTSLRRVATGLGDMVAGVDTAIFLAENAA